MNVSAIGSVAPYQAPKPASNAAPPPPPPAPQSAKPASDGDGDSDKGGVDIKV